MLLAPLLLSMFLLGKHHGAIFGEKDPAPSDLQEVVGKMMPQISALDMWALLDCSVFSVVLVAIMYLKLALYDIRRSDIFLLHNEYYRASLLQRTQQELNGTLTSDWGRRSSSCPHGSHGMNRESGGSSSGLGHLHASGSSPLERLSSGGGGRDGLAGGNGGHAGHPHSHTINRQGSGGVTWASSEDGSDYAEEGGGGGGSDYADEGGGGPHVPASPFGGGFNAERVPSSRSARRGRGGMASESGFGAGVGGWFPHSANKPTELQVLLEQTARYIQQLRIGTGVLLEQTARYIQQFERPPTVLGYRPLSCHSAADDPSSGE
ncbi:hypothetical protein T484DRAFT_1783167 [Baffinella frigidus]|nr:hypothetical protein T484DRAFT_1783167 [Cryptophyta sp. CCMP2293]